MAKTKDLYLLCNYVQKPKPGVSTSQKDFGKNPDNWQYDEIVAISRGLKSRDLKTQSVILNMTKKSIERNSMTPGATWNQVYDYFKEHYKEYITTIENELDRDAQAES